MLSDACSQLGKKKRTYVSSYASICYVRRRRRSIMNQCHILSKVDRANHQAVVDNFDIKTILKLNHTNSQ